MSNNLSVNIEALKEKIYSYLDSKDSIRGDGYIEKSVWTEFVKLDEVKGRDIKYRITEDKAKKSIGYYLTKGDTAVQSILDYCGLKVEHTEEEAQEELTDDPTPTEATGEINDNPTPNEATGDEVITDETTIADSEEVAPNGEENSTDTDVIITDKGQNTQIAMPTADENAQGKASTSSNTQNQTADNKDKTPAVIKVKKEEKKDVKEEKPVSIQKNPAEPQQKTLPTNPTVQTSFGGANKVASPLYRPSMITASVVGIPPLSIKTTKEVKTSAPVKNQTVTKAKVKKMLDIIYKDYGIQGEKLNYIEQWTNIIYENATKYNVEPEAIIAIIANECLFNINVKTGCLGIMQVSSGTAKSILNNSNNSYSNLDENLYNDVVYESGKKITFSRMEEKIKTDKNYAMKVGILVYKSKAKKAGNNQEKTFYHYNGNVNAANKDTISRRRNCGSRTAFANYPKVAAYNEKLRNLSYGTEMRLGYSYEAMRVYEILKASA